MANQKETIDLDKLADRLLLSIKTDIGNFKQIKGLGFESLKSIFKLTEDVVVEVENYNVTLKQLTGEQKKEVVIIAVSKYVDIPWVPKFIEKKVIAFVIERLVDFLNRKLGTKWGKKI